MWLHPRQWPWWGWVIAVGCTAVGMLLSAGIVYRQISLRSLEATIAQLQADGRPALPADLYAIAPTVDRDRQERLWRIINDTSGVWRNLNPTGGMEGRFDPSRTPQKRTLDSEAILAGSEVNRAQWRTLHREGPVVISGFGWLRQDFPVPDAISSVQATSLRIPNLLSLRGLGDSLATESRLSQNPQQALEDLDALVGSMSHPAT
jgi:hypothetical protein